MRTLSLLLVIAVASSAAGITSMAPSISQEVDHVFQRGGLCQALRCNSRVQKLQDFHMWDDMWWFWLDFYEGRISGLRDGFRRTGDCVYGMGNASHAMCNVRFSGLGLHYRWRLGVKDVELEPEDQLRYPTMRIEAGNMEARVSLGMTRLHLQKRSGARYFRAMMAEVDRVEVRDVAFSNYTIAWSAWLDDTKAEFLWRLRGTLAFWVKHYIQHISFLKAFNSAFVEAQK